MRQIFFMAALLTCLSARAQHTLRFIIKDDATQKPLPGVTAYIDDLKKGSTADSIGTLLLTGIPGGRYEVKFSLIGYLPADKAFSVPLKDPDQVIQINLEPISGELAEVVIQTNRTNSNRSDIPTRIEALPLEELDEKSTMRPGDIKMLLGEATGVHVQATSAVSGTVSFRIQGLDSRYTQLLQDGLPMYDGFSGGLSLVQISPLNFKQVEFIKGPVSTLYGGGAIAGLINLISKTPEADPEFTFLFNRNTAKGTDASGFYSQKWKHIGTTIFGAYNVNDAYDPGHTGFSAVPETERVTFQPKLFWNPDDKNKLWFGLNLLHENRLGGDMQVINGHADNDHQYFERNQSDRISSQLSYTYQIDSSRQFNIKNTIGYFNRTIGQPGFVFKADQVASYTEANFVSNTKQVNWVAGADIKTDHLNPTEGNEQLGYTHNTYGVFVQNTWKPVKWFAVESGLRVDDNSPSPAVPSNGLFLLPRLYTLFKLDEHWSSRIGGGLGYQMPTLFNDDSEESGYHYLQPLNISATKAERSTGGNADVNYKGAVGDVFLQVNQMVFITRVTNPLMLQNNAFVNGQGYLLSKGAETNVKILMDELGIYLGYTYTNVQQYFDNLITRQPLTPKNQFNADVTYEIEHDFRAGIEGFYTGNQLLSDGSTGRTYWTFGLLVQKMWKHLDIFVNAENLTDQRQTKWGAIYSGSVINPEFKDIYAPLDGINVNFGIRLKFGKGDL